ncbi:heparan-alpha-glucosaminide N-acetyltransferase domain-containing protein [Olsenella sp. YH-ols2223]|uniref:Heparan-alpha-glucosaminide N-acetyltransferase domain-containing protein n=1 Tax=Olsenella absiana TaxID=3115222 RepID=A0ABU7RB56_9ACTN
MGRVRVFDAVRGFSVLSMMAFHLCYDLRYLYGRPMAWFAPPFLEMTYSFFRKC